jgi:hypothetical protein
MSSGVIGDGIGEGIRSEPARSEPLVFRAGSWFLKHNHQVSFSFLVAAVLCAVFSFALPIMHYLKTERLLFSDVSIYYFLAAIVMVLAARSMKFMSERTEQ